jgi:hypothetical protein
VCCTGTAVRCSPKLERANRVLRLSQLWAKPICFGRGWKNYSNDVAGAQSSNCHHTQHSFQYAMPGLLTASSQPELLVFGDISGALLLYRGALRGTHASRSPPTNVSSRGPRRTFFVGRSVRTCNKRRLRLRTCFHADFVQPHGSAVTPFRVVSLTLLISLLLSVSLPHDDSIQSSAVGF